MRGRKLCNSPVPLPRSAEVGSKSADGAAGLNGGLALSLFAGGNGMPYAGGGAANQHDVRAAGYEEPRQDKSKAVCAACDKDTPTYPKAKDSF